MPVVKVERNIGGRTLTLETGKVAKQAHGAVMVTYGDTVVLCTVLAAPPSRDLDFFPLFVDYREAQYSAGKIPGGFFKREGRPSAKEILTMRMIDRPIRPLFPKDYKHEVQIQCLVLSTDNENDPDLLAMIGASAALSISPAPFAGPIGAGKIGYIDGEYVINPTHSDLENSEMELLAAGPREAINMIECTGKQVSEDVVAGACEKAFEVATEVMDMIDEIAGQAAREKEYEANPVPDELKQLVWDTCEAKVREAKQIAGKTERFDRLMEIRQELIDELIPEGTDPEEAPYSEGHIKEAFYKLEGKIQRDLILDGTRPDGRAMDEVRPLGFEVGVLPRTHGSALFTRGETMALVTATLGTPRDQPIIDGLLEEYKKPFFLHYNFPPFSVGEIRPIRGPGRREIGHGALAEKSIDPVMPDPEEFPYTVRVVADILESNGSTSQAATTGGSMALMNAGVPIKAPVAGISIGMVHDEENPGKYILLTDIVGEEDFHGDMDFKVAGTKDGITGIQLDMKARGISQDRIVDTLSQARKARMDILDQMSQVIAEPGELSEHAPRMLSIKIDPKKIGKVIGPGGKTINAIQDETGASIDIDDDGTIYIASTGDGAKAAKEMVEAIVEDAELGKTYKGKVVSVRDFGVFVEILPGTEGLCHVSEMDTSYVENPEDIAKVGDEFESKVINIDDQGKVKLSRKVLLDPDHEPELPKKRGGRRGHRGGGRGGRR
ncbi:MAG: polyribonucleotide nucleotidyltransferase [Phycisphaerae bacterium]|nr:polyribonucleotide nucleotidyltransferase [Phycisphaerae bacterium]